MTYHHPSDWFVLYKDDQPLGVGTAEELEASFGIPARMIQYYSYPSAIARATKDCAINKLITVRVKQEELA